MAALVPDGDREHAVQALDEAGAPRQVCLRDDLGLAAVTEGVARSGEFAVQGTVVVDLAAVGDHDQRPPGRFDDERLVAAADGGGAEPAVTENRVTTGPDPF